MTGTGTWVFEGGFHGEGVTVLHGGGHHGERVSDGLSRREGGDRSQCRAGFGATHHRWRTGRQRRPRGPSPGATGHRTDRRKSSWPSAVTVTT